MRLRFVLVMAAVAVAIAAGATPAGQTTAPSIRDAQCECDWG